MGGVCKYTNNRIHTLATKNMANGLATSILPRSLLEMQNLGPHPRLPESELIF